MGDAYLKEVYDNLSYFYDSNRTKEYFFTLLSYLKKIIPKYSKILEIGSGTGRYCIELERYGCECKGVDYSDKMVEVAKRNNKMFNTRCVFKVADIEKEIPFKEKFDFIISMDSWEFFPEPEKVLKNSYKVLRENGLLLIFTPNMLFAPAIILAERLKIKKLSPAYTYFNSFKHKVNRSARENGFRLEKDGYIFHGMTRIFYLRKI